MAAGDFTIGTTHGVHAREGHLLVINGTMEVDDTPRAFDILPTSTLIGLTVEDEDGVATATTLLNMASDGVTADNGSVYAYCNTNTVQTFRFRATYV